MSSSSKKRQREPSNETDGGRLPPWMVRALGGQVNQQSPDRHGYSNGRFFKRKIDEEEDDGIRFQVDDIQDVRELSKKAAFDFMLKCLEQQDATDPEHKMLPKMYNVCLSLATSKSDVKRWYRLPQPAAGLLEPITPIKQEQTTDDKQYRKREESVQQDEEEDQKPQARPHMETKKEPKEEE